MTASLDALNQHLDEFIASSTDPAVKREHEEKAAHLHASHQRYEAIYRRTMAMVEESDHALIRVQALKLQVQVQPAPDAATAFGNFFFQVFQFSFLWIFIISDCFSTHLFLCFATRQLQVPQSSARSIGFASV